MIYDEFADKLRREYGFFLLALTGRYLSISGTGVQVSPMLVRQLHTAGVGLQALFIAHASAQIDQLAADYPSASAHARVDAFKRELVRVTDTNIETVVDRLKGMATNTLESVKDAHGAIGLLLQKKMATPEYRVPTKSGRAYNAESLVQTEARDVGYRMWIANQLDWIVQHGDDLAAVQYPDPNHADNGMVFSITGSTKGYPSFAEIERKVFHYNAQAMIVPHVPL